MEAVPGWSGEFVQLNEGVYVMCLSVNDERMIQTPQGFALVGEMEIFGGDAMAYVYMREEAQVAGF